MQRPTTYGPAIVVLLAACAALVLAPMAWRNANSARTDAEIREASARLRAGSILDDMNQATRDLAKVVEPSVVHVSTAGVLRGRGGSRGFSSSGSGWIYDDRGHVVTNGHVVDGAQRIEVQLHDGARIPARLVGVDLRTDIAVLEVSGGDLRPAQRSSEIPEQGDLVFAFGSPFDFRFSMSSGIVSGVGRTAGLADIEYENFIQVDAAINPGNSGGPLTDIQGRVIGMNTAIATGRGNSLGQGQSAGIGLAIPMQMIENVVSQIISTGTVEKGYLGVSVAEVEELAQFRLRDPLMDFVVRNWQGDGAVVTVVGAGSPAETAGVRVGDVLMTLDGVRITTREQIPAIVSSHRPGEKLRLELWRPQPDDGGGRRLEIDVPLSRLEPENSNPLVVAALRNLGLLKLSTASPTVCRAWGLPERRGVVVEEVQPGSEAAKLLSPGSLVTDVGGQSIGSVDDLYTRISRALPASRFVPGRVPQVVLTILRRDGSTTSVPLPVALSPGTP
ncbi:MAG: trypsin-like peptidase domain-containing protein [Phycisphaerales bacterium]